MWIFIDSKLTCLGSNNLKNNFQYFINNLTKWKQLKLALVHYNTMALLRYHQTWYFSFSHSLSLSSSTSCMQNFILIALLSVCNWNTNSLTILLHSIIYSSFLISYSSSFFYELFHRNFSIAFSFRYLKKGEKGRQKLPLVVKTTR